MLTNYLNYKKNTYLYLFVSRCDDGCGVCQVKYNKSELLRNALVLWFLSLSSSVDVNLSLCDLRRLELEWLFLILSLLLTEMQATWYFCSFQHWAHISIQKVPLDFSSIKITYLWHWWLFSWLRTEVRLFSLVFKVVLPFSLSWPEEMKVN